MSRPTQIMGLPSIRLAQGPLHEHFKARRDYLRGSISSVGSVEYSSSSSWEPALESCHPLCSHCSRTTPNAELFNEARTEFMETVRIHSMEHCVRDCRFDYVDYPSGSFEQGTLWFNVCLSELHDPNICEQELLRNHAEDVVDSFFPAEVMMELTLELNQPQTTMPITYTRPNHELKRLEVVRDSYVFPPSDEDRPDAVLCILDAYVREKTSEEGVSGEYVSGEYVSKEEVNAEEESTKETKRGSVCSSCGGSDSGYETATTSLALVESPASDRSPFTRLSPRIRPSSSIYSERVTSTYPCRCLAEAAKRLGRVFAHETSLADVLTQLQIRSDVRYSSSLSPHAQGHGRSKQHFIDVLHSSAPFIQAQPSSRNSQDSQNLSLAPPLTEETSEVLQHANASTLESSPIPSRPQYSLFPRTRPSQQMIPPRASYISESLWSEDSRLCEKKPSMRLSDLIRFWRLRAPD